LKLVEINIGSATLLVGAPAGFSTPLIRAGDGLGAIAAIPRLRTDPEAMARLRSLYPPQVSNLIGTDDVLARLRGDLASGRMRAVLIRECPIELAPVPEQVVASHVVHLQLPAEASLPARTLLLAARGRMPMEFRGSVDNVATAAALVAGLRQDRDLPRLLRRQVSRLRIGFDDMTDKLEDELAEKLRNNLIDGAVLREPGLRALAFSRRETPLPIADMTPGQRVAEAMLCSRSRLDRAELGVVSRICDPDNLGRMAALLCSGGEANALPFTAPLHDGTMVAIAWDFGGAQGIDRLAGLFTAATEAARAISEDGIEAAAETMAMAFTRAGPDLLAALLRRALREKGGRQGEEKNWKGKLNDENRNTEVAKPQQKGTGSGASKASSPPPPPPPKKAASIDGNSAEWTLDARGRPVKVTATLTSVKPEAGDRGSGELSAQDKIRALGKKGDDAGHMIGHRFMGDQGENNLFPQQGNFNKGAYKKLENEWADWIDRGCTVKVNVELSGGTSDRPDEVAVSYEVFDKSGKRVHEFEKIFKNEANQKVDRLYSDGMKKALK
jgi:DNA/RNA non-specific endonuclease